MSRQCNSHRANVQASLVVARLQTRRYALTVAANSATGFCSPTNTKAHKRHRSTAGAFFVPAVSFTVAVRRALSSAPGSFVSGLQTCVQPPPNLVLQQVVAAPHTKELRQMKHVLNPSKIRASAHRAMALAALHANSSLSVRLRRWNHHMAIVRALENVGGAQ